LAHWRFVLHCLFIVLTAGSAVAEISSPMASYPITQAACRHDNVLAEELLRLSIGCDNQNRLCEMGHGAGASCVHMVVPAGVCCYAIASTSLVGRGLEDSLVDDESLGRVSGGAALFATPDVLRQGLFTILLWDEVKPKRGTTYAQGNGQIDSTILVQGR
jgi:hypothetical protein